VEQRKGHDQDQIDLASDFLALVCREHVTLEQRPILRELLLGYSWEGRKAQGCWICSGAYPTVNFGVNRSENRVIYFPFARMAPTGKWNAQRTLVLCSSDPVLAGT
jgi:hypothetical protein